MFHPAFKIPLDASSNVFPDVDTWLWFKNNPMFKPKLNMTGLSFVWPWWPGHKKDSVKQLRKHEHQWCLTMFMDYF